MINQSAGLAAGASGDHAHVVTEPGHWNNVHEPAAGVKASVTLAALPKGRHVCRELTFSASVATIATTVAAMHVRLLDGPSGSAAILRSWALSEAGIVKAIEGMAIVGSVNTPMTLEFSVAPTAAGDFQAVGFGGYDVTDGV
ncbi:MAG: hypothetical protein ACYC9X_00670 [Dehalococcoidia bacterium]